MSYNSAPNLSPDGRAKIVFEQLSLADSLAISVCVSPVRGARFVREKEQSDWTAREGACESDTWNIPMIKPRSVRGAIHRGRTYASLSVMVPGCLSDHWVMGTIVQSGYACERVVCACNLSSHSHPTDDSLIKDKLASLHCIFSPNTAYPPLM